MLFRKVLGLILITLSLISYAFSSEPEETLRCEQDADDCQTSDIDRRPGILTEEQSRVAIENLKLHIDVEEDFQEFRESLPETERSDN